MRATQPSDEYITPQPIADLAKKTLGDVYFDPYGHPCQRVKVRTMHTRSTGSQPWPTTGPWWINPPFSQSAEQIPRVAQWLSGHEIEGLLLCLAAPGSKYWRESIWSKTGPQRIAWLSRISFDQFDERETIPEYTDLKAGRQVSSATYQMLVRKNSPRVADIMEQQVPNPAYRTVSTTEHGISRDIVLMLWSKNPVTVNRFVREVQAYAKEADPTDPPIGISLGGGAS